MSKTAPPPPPEPPEILTSTRLPPARRKVLPVPTKFSRVTPYPILVPAELIPIPLMVPPLS